MYVIISKFIIIYVISLYYSFCTLLNGIILASNHVPNKINIANIVSALVCISHRSALHCGIVDANGDIINPINVGGTHK